MRWTWDLKKERANKKKHGLSFETACLVFLDPFVTSRPDPTSVEERWQSLGTVGGLVLFVVHTWPEAEADEGSGRIISARRATAHERKAYEEGNF